MSLPKGAGELRCYKRYYTVVRGKQLEEFGMPTDKPVEALLVGRIREPGAQEQAGLEWVENTSKIPAKHDGGCSNMLVLYAAGWPTTDIKAMCSLDFGGNIPIEIKGQPLTC